MAMIVVLALVAPTQVPQDDLVKVHQPQEKRTVTSNLLKCKRTKDTATTSRLMVTTHSTGTMATVVRRPPLLRNPEGEGLALDQETDLIAGPLTSIMETSHTQPIPTATCMLDNALTHLKHPLDVEAENTVTGTRNQPIPTVTCVLDRVITHLKHPLDVEVENNVTGIRTGIV